MYYLYVNNIRGFTDTLIPLKNVNFLVGENSTGKTTILDLFYLLNSRNFWFNPKFNTEEITFGSFHDLINIKSNNTSSFNVGMVKITKDIHHSSEFEFIALTFSENNQFPEVTQVNYINRYYEVIFKIEKNCTKYFFNKNQEKLTFSEDLIKNTIQLWFQSKKIDKLQFKSLDKSHYENFLYIPGLFFSLNPEDLRNIPDDFALPSFFSDMQRTTWIAPIRSKPKKTYDEYDVSFTPEGAHTPYLIRNIYNKKDKQSRDFKELLNKIGVDSGLYDEIKIRNYSKEIGSPFRIEIKLNDNCFKIINTGYGVSQSLPIIVELILRPKNTIFAIQQPEVHLHPRAQAALGDLIFHLAYKDNKQFLIETHSDFIMDRFRIDCKKFDQNKNLDFQVLFFEKSKNGNTVSPIKIKKSGEYEENQPKGFRNFFIKEDLALLEI